MNTTPAQPAPLVGIKLTSHMLDRITAQAQLLAADPEWNKWRAYEAAKGAIQDFDQTEDEYQRAIRELAAALDV